MPCGHHHGRAAAAATAGYWISQRPRPGESRCAMASVVVEESGRARAEAGQLQPQRQSSWRRRRRRSELATMPGRRHDGLSAFVVISAPNPVRSGAVDVLCFFFPFVGFGLEQQQVRRVTRKAAARSLIGAALFQSETAGGEHSACRGVSLGSALLTALWIQGIQGLAEPALLTCAPCLHNKSRKQDHKAFCH